MRRDEEVRGCMCVGVAPTHNALHAERAVTHGVHGICDQEPRVSVCVRVLPVLCVCVCVCTPCAKTVGCEGRHY